MGLDIELSLKKGYEILRKCSEMKIYAILLFLNSLILTLYSYGMPSFNSLVKVENGELVYVSPYLTAYIALFVLLIIVVLVFSILFTSASIKSSYDYLRGKNSSYRSMRNAVKVFPSVFGASILYFLAIIFPIILGIFLIIGGCCLLAILIPILILYIAIRLVFFLYPIVIFRRKAMEGLKESWEISHGNVLEVGLLLLILSLFELPLGIVTQLAKNNIAVSVITSFILSFINMWILATMTVAYLQLKGVYGRKGLIEKKEEVYSIPKNRAILLIGFTPDEVDRIKGKGLPAYPISQEARMFTVREIIAEPGRYSGDALWTSGKYAIIHGFDGSQIPDILNTINTIAGGKVNFATTTETSVEWTLSYLLKEIGETI